MENPEESDYSFREVFKQAYTSPGENEYTERKHLIEGKYIKIPISIQSNDERIIFY